ncbi:MAG: hypothetical protein IJ501_02915 [Bacilli bacterium]|nr:hypothetical protein [Bacilli bacterium]
MKLFKILFIFLILGFLGLYFAYSNGYYETMQREKVSLTNKQIEEFEEALMNGEEISLDAYKLDNIDYSTNTSKLSLKVSNSFENIVDYGIKFIFRKISNVIE